MPDDGLLAIYLNDHLAGATGGVELARRAAASNPSGELGRLLSEVTEEVEVHRETLLEVMRTLDIGTDRLKTLAGWSAEKVGRLKLNGRLWGYSPLSRVVELEALILASRGRLSMWRTLARLGAAELADFDLEGLAEEAALSLERLESERERAASQAFG